MIAEEQATGGDTRARALLRGHYENFWVSSPLVPRRLRPHLARIYAFCRLTDDLGDELGTGAEAALHGWRDDLLRCYADPPAPADPLLARLTETISEFQLEPALFLDLIEANLRDQRVTRYDVYQDLLEYCQLSAAPVGRMVLRLYRIRDQALDRWSDDVCIGLQLANFAQDVRVDRDKGRTYLLQPELQRLGVAGAVTAMCARAEALLSSGIRLEAAVPYRLSVQLSLYRRGGMAILAAIKRAGYATDRVRPRVSNPTKAGLLVVSLLESLRRHADAHQYRQA